VLVLTDGRSFKQRCPHQWTGIVEVVASLNLERVENGKPPLLVLAFEPGDPPYVGYWVCRAAAARRARTRTWVEGQVAVGWASIQE